MRLLLAAPLRLHLCIAVNKGAEAAILTKVGLQDRPSADIWELGFQAGSHFLIRVAHCSYTVQTRRFYDEQLLSS